MKLSDLLAELEAEGVTGEKAEEAVERFIKMQKSKRDLSGDASGAALAKRDGDDLPARFSAQVELGRGRKPVDYGDETPAEAEMRWRQQEMADPEGIYAGGSTAGGIFGNDPIATEGYDPGARRRTAEMDHLRASTAEKIVMVKVLNKIADKLGIGSDEISGLLDGDDAGPQRRLPGRGR